MKIPEEEEQTMLTLRTNPETLRSSQVTFGKLSISENTNLIFTVNVLLYGTHFNLAKLSDRGIIIVK
jgi:hypothetical protein